MRITSPYRKRERGTQLAELAMVLPLLLLLVAIVVEGAGFIRVHQILNNAAREGARVAALRENLPDVEGDHTAGVKQVVATYACNNGVALVGSGYSCDTANPGVVCNGASITVVQDLSIATPNGLALHGSRVTATCTYQPQFFSSLPWFGGPSSVPLTGTAEFQNFD